MSELVGLLCVAAIFSGIGVYAVVKWLPAPQPKEEIRGTWHRAQEAVAMRDGSRIRVVLIREYRGEQTGRLVVADIDSTEPNWTAAVQNAIAEADNRLATLESGEQR